MSGPSTARRSTAGATFDRRGERSPIPSQRSPVDAYRVSEEQLRRARMVVARNAMGSQDCRDLLEMLGLLSPNPDQAPPIRR